MNGLRKYGVEFYLATKKNETLLFAGKWTAREHRLK
jgi:hypothetical protein